MSGGRLRLMCNDLLNIVYRYIHRYKLKQVNASYKDQFEVFGTGWVKSKVYWTRYNYRWLEYAHYDDAGVY
jgi:hypothetical protein